MSESARPRVLIEDWLPTVELGIESRRERAAASALPPLSFLHVWWARRPLAVSAGTILGSLMPAWTPALASEYPSAPELKTAEGYRAWFLHLCGILGDPIAAKKRLDFANANGIKLSDNGYGYKQAYKNSPSTSDLELLRKVLRQVWGQVPVVCDPTAGGGSIPYEVIRYGIRAIANDLNPVAAAVLRAGIAVPAQYGAGLGADIRTWGRILCDRLEKRLEPVFELEADHERVVAYIFARTITCPRTGKLVPLAPNWWLRKGSKSAAVRLVAEHGGEVLDGPEFEIVGGDAIDFDPNQGTVARGDAVSPWDGLVIDGDYIKAEAQAGRMGSMLYAVAIRTAKGSGFRAPTQVDLDALAVAGAELERLLPQWEADDVLPIEEIPDGGNETSVPRRYGMSRWRDMFSPRQLLVHGTFVEEFRRLAPEVRAALGTERGDAVLTELALMQAKGLNYDSRLCVWHPTRNSMANTFDRHDFSFKWTHGEFEGARELYPWCLSQILDAYEGIARLLEPSDAASLSEVTANGRPSPVVSALNGADLGETESRSIELVCIDPPYYDNVMYAELSDFFYVWEKRTLGLIHPDLFTTELTDKQNEAVSNPARFADFGARRKELANADYQAKMAAIFAECDRVLRDDGVLTVMFTHKRAEAWDTLGTALMEAGFTIETSWPVNTESEHSLHQARKNAAASTIMLVCRKREPAGEDDPHPYFEDLEGEVRQASREALERFSASGIEGVDLLLSTYGPALSVISSAWPVYSSEADASGRSRLLRPEEALHAAREEVVRLQRRRLVGVEATLDPLSDFTLIAWDTFRAAEFPFDEARRLALAVGGLDVDELVRAKLVSKKSGTVELLPPATRVRRGDDDALPGVRPGATTFSAAIDAVHTVMHVADADGLPAAKALMDRADLSRDSAFTACVQGLVNSIPRTKEKGEWVRPEAGTLDRLCTAFLPEIEIPPDPVVELDFEQEELDLPGA
jgi:adenine-specific DNA methylase